MLPKAQNIRLSFIFVCNKLQPHTNIKERTDQYNIWKCHPEWCSLQVSRHNRSQQTTTEREPTAVNKIQHEHEK